MVATWNVMTMRTPGKMQEITGKMMRWNTNILVIQEKHRPGHGMIDKTYYRLTYSGQSTEQDYWTGFMIKKNLGDSLIDYETKNDRIYIIKMKERFTNITILSIYATTEERE